ncbi:WD40-repeat-containing domain protein [Fimicolochytrium jonesii]|uniref:WD40-repeat-containing domain protein n=1 Tax=Fimicolochytrium jonesii TaxID=1396493 RepID=UPI0022FE310E|nr:WD40-repeat-containing domain protein [Fimicolochytrium jonesii]KAI8816525.1 WD40-repeat-containing domain protein [Fimicolochytrium jonesii]
MSKSINARGAGPTPKGRGPSSPSVSNQVVKAANDPPALPTHLPHTTGGGTAYALHSPDAPFPSLAFPTTRSPKTPIIPPTSTLPLSDRPLMCADYDHDKRCMVVGCADHALYEATVVRGVVGGPGVGLRTVRTLYGKTAGHSEWVTCCAYVPGGGGVVSGGMDSTLHLWHPTLPTSTPLHGHQGSITHLACSSGPSSIAVSSSYDGTLRAWSLRTHTPLAIWGGDIDGALARGDYMAATRNPVLGFRWDGARLVSLTKSGRICVFDTGVAMSRPVTSIQAHQGATRHVVTAVSCPEILTTAGNLDGCLRRFDLRVSAERGRCVRKNESLHRGGVTNLLAIPGGGLVTTGGGDGTVKVVDADSLAVVRAVQVVDVPAQEVGSPRASVYAMAVTQQGVGVCAFGDGVVRAVDLEGGNTVAVLDARAEGIRNALRDIRIVEDDVVLGSGDDGIVVAWKL